MSARTHRLPADAPKGLGGAIDRSRPVSFRLNGRTVSGFEGDSVFSALLASGVDILGSHLGQRIGLTRAAAPAIARADAIDPVDALPMERTPVTEGADYVTQAPRQRLAWDVVMLRGRTLGLDLDNSRALERPWLAADGRPGAADDLAIVGGGVAGLSAALTAARAGLSVALFEASAYLGGHSGLFGTQDSEERPEDAMARLSAEVTANPAVTVFLDAEVVSVRAGLLRAHRVSVEDGVARGEMIDVPAARIILATGAEERLPLFAGNRLPGVMGALESYELASRFGIWPGRSLAVATSGNCAYRLGTLARDNEIAVTAIIDARPGPSSRFIDFAKAYGIRQMTGRVPQEVRTNRSAKLLEIDIGDEMPITAERLIVSGSWQPDLKLWHIAGGPSIWNEAHQRIEAVGGIEGIALAGSAAGYFTRQGCIQSGADAVNRLLGRKRRPFADPVIDPLYETPDSALADLGERETNAITYLDGGGALLTRPSLPPRRWYDRFRTRSEPELPALSEASQSLTLGTIAAGVTLGLVPRDSAGFVAQERVAIIPLTVEAPSEKGPAEAAVTEGTIPKYLENRFGADAVLTIIEAEDGRRLGPGALIFGDLDNSDPMAAVGVVLRSTTTSIEALISASAAQGSLYARDHGQSVAVTPVRSVKTGSA
ncbi:MAG: FAD-dependent oxidoreductase [Devosia sp.]|uniref:FAD-dependent oxidoreductase n=1 Tax=Devosia sp. TaxID=1871048 RepID=UPI0019F9193B|nr:FAD-dependent oxidoreductase [Devosia sp.]MBF0680861.1 FAD-dependent oxidoreductase [Devosia sp.]